VIFTQFGMEKGVPGLHPHAKFHHFGFKNVGLQHPKSPKLVFFGTNFPQMGIPFSALFMKLGLGEGVPRSHPHA